MQTQSNPASRKLVKTRHPGIYRRGSRYVVVHEYRGKQTKRAARTIGEALTIQGEFRQPGGAAYMPAGAQTFAGYAATWLDTYRGRTRRGVGELTREDYARSLRLYLVPEFGTTRLADITPPDVRRLIRRLEDQGKKATTIRGILAPLKALFATAVEDGALRSNPAAGVRITGRDEAPEEVRALTRVEFAALLAEVPEDWRLFVEFLTHTGLRISEALGLTWEAIAFGERPRVVVREQLCRGKRRSLKSDHSRRDVPLTAGMAQRLWKLGAKRAPDAPVFSTSIGTALSASNVRNRVLAPARIAAGMEWVSFHTFRHTCASHLFDAGMNIKQVSAWLGHSDAAFTQRTYVHLIDGGIGAAPAAFDALGVSPDTPAHGEPEPAATEGYAAAYPAV
jgi:integrase